MKIFTAPGPVYHGPFHRIVAFTGWGGFSSGRFLAIAHTAVPYCTVIDTNDGSLFTPPPGVVTGTVGGLSVSWRAVTGELAVLRHDVVVVYRTTKTGFTERWRMTIPYGYPNAPGRVAYSPDGAYLAVTTWDYRSKIYDAETFALITTLDADSGAAQWSPDGSKIWHLAPNAGIKVYLVSNWLPRLLASAPGSVQTITSWAPNGQTALVMENPYPAPIKWWWVDFSTWNAVGFVQLGVAENSPPAAFFASDGEMQRVINAARGKNSVLALELKADGHTLVALEDLSNRIPGSVSEVWNFTLFDGNALIQASIVYPIVLTASLHYYPQGQLIAFVSRDIWVGEVLSARMLTSYYDRWATFTQGGYPHVHADPPYNVWPHPPLPWQLELHPTVDNRNGAGGFGDHWEINWFQNPVHKAMPLPVFPYPQSQTGGYNSPGSATFAGLTASPDHRFFLTLATWSGTGVVGTTSVEAFRKLFILDENGQVTFQSVNLPVSGYAVQTAWASNNTLAYWHNGTLRFSSSNLAITTPEPKSLAFSPYIPPPP